ncbi:MAG: hypothetical protein QM719_12910 [Thermomonas sp.]
MASSKLQRDQFDTDKEFNDFGAFLDERAGNVQHYMNATQFLDWQAHDNWSAFKMASAGPALGLATSAAALSPAIAAAEMLYGGIQSVRDLRDGHYVRGTVGLALAVVGARGVASEWSSVNSARSALYNSKAAVLNAGQPASLNGVKALDQWALANTTPINGATRSVPLGFESEAHFMTAADELQNALRASGIDDAVIGVRGSSVTGQSWRTGNPFSEKSDIDFFVESSQLTDGYLTSPNIPGFVNPKPILRDYPLLRDWSNKWQIDLGRKITPGGFVPGTVPNNPAIIVGG